MDEARFQLNGSFSCDYHKMVKDNHERTKHHFKEKHRVVTIVQCIRLLEKDAPIISDLKMT